MTSAQALRWMWAITVLGGTGLIALAASAASEGVWSAAAFIGALGLALYGTVGWSVWSARRPRTVG